MMKLPKELTTVTPLSKSLAVALFIALPIAGFFLGMQYQKTMNPANKDEDSSMKACTLDAKICPDGSYVGRQGPNCEFSACPSEDSETANWKTYTDSQIGYSIKYPTEIIPSRGNCDSFIYPASEEEKNRLTDIKNSGKEIAYSVEGLEFSFCILSNPNKLDALTFAQNESKESIFISTILDGSKGVKSETEAYGEYFIETPDNKLLRIWYRIGDTGFKKHFDQILSTFKFTDSTTNISQGAMGKIEIAPTCAGPGSPPGRPEEICSKPFEGTVIVKKKDTKKVVTRFTTNSEGEFTIELSAGTYILEPITTVGLPGMPKQFDLVVTANKVTQVTISIDTGIR